MNKEKLFNLLERFEEIEAEKGIKYPDIFMTIEVTSNSHGVFYHYVYVKDNDTDTSLLCHINGFNKQGSTDGVETIGDVVELLEEKKQYEQHLYIK